MIRVKIVQRNQKYAVGSVQNLTNNEAFGLLDSGLAILSKDLTEQEYKIKDGKPSNLRTNKRK